MMTVINIHSGMRLIIWSVLICAIPLFLAIPFSLADQIINFSQPDSGKIINMSSSINFYNITNNYDQSLNTTDSVTFEDITLNGNGIYFYNDLLAYNQIFIYPISRDMSITPGPFDFTLYIGSVNDYPDGHGNLKVWGTGNFEEDITAPNFIGNGNTLTGVCLSNGTNCNVTTNSRIDSINSSKAGIGSYNCSTDQALQNVTSNISGIYGQCVPIIQNSTTYYPNITATTGGTNTTSNITLMWYYDSLTYNISEGSGINSLTTYINYTNVTKFDQWILREYYLGSSSHNLQFQIYDYGSATWETYFSVVGQSGFNWLIIPIFDYTEHINSGLVQTRIIHIESGISSHRLYIDVAWLLSGNNIGSSTNLDGFARYNFGFNNFNGNGYFNTSSDINASNFNGNWNGSNTKAGVGNYNCSTGQVLQNITSNISGIFGQCVTPTSSNPFNQVLNTTSNVTFNDGNFTGYVRSEKIKNAFLKVSHGSGDGFAGGYILAGMSGIPFNQSWTFYKLDPGNNYNDTTNMYKIPIDGIYKCTVKARAFDSAASEPYPGTPGVSYGIGCDIWETYGEWWEQDVIPMFGDSPAFMWHDTSTSAGGRNGLMNINIFHATAGQRVGMYGYSDDGATYTTDSSMVIELMFPD